MPKPSITITEVFPGERASTRLSTYVDDFDASAVRLHEWLWSRTDVTMATRVIMGWMRGEFYAEQLGAVAFRYYVPGEVGHWFDFLYRS